MCNLVGRALGHYRVVEKIGEGGMGEVYRAHDERLDRDVAIKVLPEEVADRPDRMARFEREAKALAALNHPNIATIHGFETASAQAVIPSEPCESRDLGGGSGQQPSCSHPPDSSAPASQGDASARNDSHEVTFLVMELLEGETLRERLEGGALGWRKAAEIGEAIADGLGAAHDAGIVHRDLKPSNVFLTEDGRVKVLDFGLARHEKVTTEKSVTHAPTVTRHTDPGTVFGTVGYMSPEQVRGETVDHRSDVFALGCVLYEMVSGRRAFTGDSAVETMNSILKEEPEEVPGSGRATPAELVGTIRRCVEKKPRSRYQSASDLAYNLRTISSASSPLDFIDGARRAPRWRIVGLVVAAAAILMIAASLTKMWKSGPEGVGDSPKFGTALDWVAVAPFENRTGDLSLDPLGQRAVDLIVQKFSKLGMADGIRTVDALPAPTEGGQVAGKGPHALVSGSYYLDGDALEFQARLTDYDTGELLYGFKPIVAARPDLAGALEGLCERIVVSVQFHSNSRFDIRHTNPPSTYDSWMAFNRGWDFFGADYGRAVPAFRESLELDPGFHFARVTLIISLINFGQPESGFQELAAARLHYDELTEFERAYLSLCEGWLSQRPVEALTHVRHMVSLAPHLPWARYAHGFIAYRLNRPREALDALQPILPAYEPAAQPASHWALVNAIRSHHLLGEYQQALEWANVGLEIFPDVGFFFVQKGAALVALGRIDEVYQVIEECARIQLRGGPGSTEVMAYMALVLRANGHVRESENLNLRLFDQWQREWAESDIEELSPVNLRYRSWTLRVAGRWSEARIPLLELERRGESSIHVKGPFGVIAARLGDREEALKIFDDLAEPGPGHSLESQYYWQACIASCLGDKDRAVELLKKSYQNGGAHEWEDHIDVDLEPLWDYPPFQELIAPKG